MKKDFRIHIYRQDDVVWSTWAESQKLMPEASDVESELAQADVKLRCRFHYTRKLDPVLRNPTNYNVRVEQRQLPKPTIQALTQSPCGRYVTLEV